MNRVEALWAVLNEEYGIFSIEELDKAAEKQEKLDISVFIEQVKGKKQYDTDSGHSRIAV